MGFNKKDKEFLNQYLGKYEISNIRSVAILGWSELPYHLWDHVVNFDAIKHHGNEIIVNLNQPISPEYHNMFDLILDAGTLEHIFNVPVCLESLHHMLKDDGIIYHNNPHEGFYTHGFYQFNAEFFLTYYQGYTNVNCQIINPIGDDIKYHKRKRYKYNDLIKRKKIIFIAQKSGTISSDIFQGYYCS